MSRYWRCRRVSQGALCGTLNLSVKKKCTACGKLRPPRRKPGHLVALELPYAEWIDLNGGEHCAICKRGPSADRRLDRDHDHRTGKARGLLCHRCNRALPDWISASWLLEAASYLERG